MIFSNYDQLTEHLMGIVKRRHFAVVCAEEAHTLDAVCASFDKGIIIPHLIGKKEKIQMMLREKGLDPDAFDIVNEEVPSSAAETAAAMVRNGAAGGLIKGGIDTATFMRVMLHRETGFKKSPVVCAMSLMQIPGYHKLVAGSDPAICIMPGLEEKQAIISNCVSALTNLGVTEPKVAVLAPSEIVNPKIPESVDAAQLKQLNSSGVIKGCVIDGPLSYDLCFSKEAAAAKNVSSTVAGDPDLIIYPNLSTGNAVSKALVINARAVGSSVILGTSVPVVLPSRSGSVEEKVRDILLASACAG